MALSFEVPNQGMTRKVWGRCFIPHISGCCKTRLKNPPLLPYWPCPCTHATGQGISLLFRKSHLPEKEIPKHFTLNLHK